MSVLGEVIRRDLSRRRRDPVGLLVQLAIPLALLLVFRFAFGTSAEERTPRARLLVVDADSSLVSRFVTGALSQGGLSKIIDAQAADSVSAMRLLRREKASGAVFIPRGFGADFLAARPTRLTLYKNPSERILPSILEEVLATMADGGGAAQALLAEPMGRISRMQSGGSALPESAVAGVSVSVQRAIARSGRYLLPPVIELKTEVPTGKKGPSFMELFFPGLVFMAVVFLSQSIALDTGEERRRGTLRRSLAMGVSPWHLFLGKVLAGLALILPAMGLVFLLGHWFIGTPVARLLAGWALVSATAFATLSSEELRGARDGGDPRRSGRRCPVPRPVGPANPKNPRGKGLWQFTESESIDGCKYSGGGPWPATEIAPPPGRFATLGPKGEAPVCDGTKTSIAEVTVIDGLRDKSKYVVPPRLKQNKRTIVVVHPIRDFSTGGAGNCAAAKVRATTAAKLVRTPQPLGSGLRTTGGAVRERPQDPKRSLTSAESRALRRLLCCSPRRA